MSKSDQTALGLLQSSVALLQDMRSSPSCPHPRAAQLSRKSYFAFMSHQALPQHSLSSLSLCPSWCTSEKTSAPCSLQPSFRLQVRLHAPLLSMRTTLIPSAYPMHNLPALTASELQYKNYFLALGYPNWIQCSWCGSHKAGGMALA